MDYVLVNDDCDHCRYVSNAFTFLQLSFIKLSLTECRLSTMNAATAVMICPNIEETHKIQVNKMIQTTKTSIILFSPPPFCDPTTKTPIYFLKVQFNEHDLKNVLQHCAHTRREGTDLSNEAFPVFTRLVGRSPQITKVKEMIRQVANSDVTVLILGESGTGKDVIASCIHHLSDRKSHPLVPINCGAIPSELMESELFGHEKGAFTGALTRRPGRFEMANGGTLFLDEIGDMPLPMQVKLLRVLQERKIERVGGNVSIDVNTRLIAATNKHLEELIETHQFREDLYYRLNVFPIHVPSLWERTEDISLLIDYHLDKIYERLKRRVIFSDRAKELLCEYSWPGNIRELQNFLERMVILHPDSVVSEKDIDLTNKNRKTLLQDTPLVSEVPFNIREYLAKIEQKAIEAALERSNGVVNAAAEYLSLGRTTLIEKMKKYNLSSS